MKFTEQFERGECDLPVSFSLLRLPHREIIWERNEGNPRRRNPFLHRERNRRDTLLLDGHAYQPHGPMAQGSRRSEQHNVYPIVYELLRDLGGSSPDERSGVAYGAHEGEVPAVELSQDPFDFELPEGPQGEDSVEVVLAPVGGIVGMSPREDIGTVGDLAVGTITRWIVYVEAHVFRQVNAAGGDERQAALT
jgi:hypothetical protein